MRDPTLMISAKAVIEAGSAILVLHPSQIDANRKWHIPGGLRDDILEPISQTVVREVREETGIDLSGVAPKPCKVGEWSAVDHGRPVRVLAVFFYFRLPERPGIHLSHEHDDAAWLDHKNYRSFDANKEVYELVEELFTGQFTKNRALP